MYKTGFKIFVIFNAMIFAFTTTVEHTSLNGKLASKVWKDILQITHLIFWMLQPGKYLIYDYFYFLILIFSALMSKLPLLLNHGALVNDQQYMIEVDLNYKIIPFHAIFFFSFFRFETGDPTAFLVTWAGIHLLKRKHRLNFTSSCKPFLYVAFEIFHLTEMLNLTTPDPA